MPTNFNIDDIITAVAAASNDLTINDVRVNNQKHSSLRRLNDRRLVTVEVDVTSIIAVTDGSNIDYIAKANRIATANKNISAIQATLTNVNSALYTNSLSVTSDPAMTLAVTAVVTSYASSIDQAAVVAGVTGIVGGSATVTSQVSVVAPASNISTSTTNTNPAFESDSRALLVSMTTVCAVVYALMN